MKKHIVSAFSYPVENMDLIEQAKKIAEREEKTLSALINELLAEYVKIHKEGNPIHPLTKWADPNFKSFPAFKERLTQKWIPYMQENCNENELQEIAEQAEGILNNAMKIKRSRF